MEIQELSRSVQRLAAEFEPLNIAAIYLFGSRAQGLARKTSDYDFGVLLQRPVGHGPRRRELYDRLYALFDGLVGEPTNLDIVFLHDAPIHLRQHVIRHGIVLFETDPILRGRFHERTMTETADFEFHRKRFEAATLKRIS